MYSLYQVINTMNMEALAGHDPACLGLQPSDYPFAHSAMRFC